MKEFPEFMKNALNHIDSKQQNTPDIDGYYYEGKDGSQICFWTYYSDRESKENIHELHYRDQGRRTARPRPV